MKLKHSYFLLYLSLFLAMLPLHPVTAEADKTNNRFFAEASLGIASPKSSNYDDADFRNIQIGANLRHLELTLGYIHDMEFDSKSLPNTTVSVNGFSVGLRKTFQLARLFAIAPQLGAFGWDADATFLGNQAGSEDDISVWYGLGFYLTPHPRISLLMNMQRYNKVSDTDLNTLSFGLMGHF